MDGLEFSAAVEQFAHQVLTWVGFGTLAGLLAKAIMPGRDPGGAVTTLLTGLGGTIVGGGVLTYFYEGLRIKPISVIGFIVATGGAIVLLFSYRLLAGRFFVEGERVPPPYGLRRRRRAVPRVREQAIYEE